MAESGDILPDWISFYAEGEVAKRPNVTNKFARAVNDLLALLPADDRCRMLSRYDKGKPLEVQLRDSHHSLKEGPTKDACAQCTISELGDELIFKAATVHALPEKSLRHLIAHE